MTIFRTVVQGCLQLTHFQVETILSVENASLVVAIPVDRGWIIAESEDLSQRVECTTGAVPEWVQECARLRAVGFGGELVQTAHSHPRSRC